MQSVALIGLLVGGIAPLGPRAAPSGIMKRSVVGPIVLTETGFIGDAQGDTRRHGGPEKAVHHYPFDHYKNWAPEIGENSILSGPGAFGENLSTTGVSEADIAIGDVFRLGSAVLQVSQGRRPCWKLNERFSTKTMAREVQRTGRTGWYYRVLQKGVVSPDDALVLDDRRSPEWTVFRIWQTFYVNTMDRGELHAIAALPTLAQGWRDHASRRLSSGQVEDWKLRLEGPH
ncbi:MOSC domain-containing protein [Rhizobium sp.]|uniref:MOSC domain-containing protein n=1 Tax=Rhizobium sp. TaxID=391 RepID=UPI0028977F5F